MAELQLVGVGPHGKREQLMTEANAEHRLFPDQRLHRCDGFRHILRVARAVREEHGVGRERKHFLRRRRGGKYGELIIPELKRLQDIPFYAQIEHRDMKAVALDGVRLRRRGLPNDARFRRRGKKLRHRLVGRILRDDDALHRSLRSYMARDAARIDLMETRDILALKEFPYRARRKAVAADFAELPGDQPAHERFSRLHENFVDTVIPDQGVCECDNLTAIRGIGQDFLIAGHARVEHDLSHCIRFPEKLTGKRRAVL